MKTANGFFLHSIHLEKCSSSFCIKRDYEQSLQARWTQLNSSSESVKNMTLKKKLENKKETQGGMIPMLC